MAVIDSLRLLLMSQSRTGVIVKDEITRCIRYSLLASALKCPKPNGVMGVDSCTNLYP